MRKIVVFVDVEDQRLTSRLVDLARELTGAGKIRLYLVDIEMPDSDYDRQRLRRDVSRDGIAGRLRHRHHVLHILQAELRHLNVNATALMVRDGSTRGNTARKVLDEVQRLKPDLVIVGSHHHGMLHHLFSTSVSDSLVHRANRPVLVVPQTRSDDRPARRAPKSAARAKPAKRR